MDTHRSHLKEKSPCQPAGRHGQGTALAGRWREFGAASAIDDGRYPLCRLSVGIALALNMSSGLLAVGLTKIGPVDVGSKFFAAHGPCGSFFNVDAAVDGDIPTDPLTDCSRSDRQQPRQIALASNCFCGFLDWVHSQSLDRLHFASQAPLNRFF